MDDSLGRILTIKYYPKDETIGHKEPPLLQVFRDGEGSGRTYEMSNYYSFYNCPEDVYLFIEENCSKPFYEAEYSYCLEMVILNEMEGRFLELKEKALKMQGDLTKENKRSYLKLVQTDLFDANEGKSE
tara:strand:+ start:345 stop:731 length:387 start_codon:yes stop_codon:yes gene_type:complete